MNRSYTAIDAEEKFLQHHGILGMHWGIRKDDSNDFSYSKVSDKKIRTNKDGSKTIPRGFIFNRVARSEKLDPNVSGGLYVSYGKPDAARYVSNLGPTLLAKLVKEDNDYLQTISTKKNLKLASDDYVNSTVLKVASNNDDIIKKFNGSLYSAAYFNDYNKTIKQTAFTVENILSIGSLSDFCTKIDNF